MDRLPTRPLREGAREPGSTVLDRWPGDPREHPVTAPAPRRPRPVDVVVTILLLVVLAALAVVASFLGLLVAMSADACTVPSSCLDWVSAGTLVAVAAPVACWTAALVGSVVAMVQGRRAVWIPLAGIMAWVGLVAVALALAGIGTEITSRT